ncbi:hypothetical protein [Sandaracinus amylolyticus]|uniref:hypothetical protein n=1 Tax=Sandaracinus amylolyticus TaxID=927083 RepID=UPI001F1EB142|nr:hypothetical protein [Sandaracinus amylolyticus]UJR86930.1 Hypothetical protein I5071_90310 [Sandaracinus amylolyticus]
MRGTTHVAVPIVIAVLAAVALPSVAVAQTPQPYTPPGYESAPPPDPSSPPPSYGYEQPSQPTDPGAAYGNVAPAAPYGTPVAPPAARARRVPVERSETIRGLWLPGLIVLPIAWVTTWTVSTTVFFDDAATFSWIPVIGPWLMLTQDLNGYEAGIVVSGVVQGLAALAIVLGLTIRRTYTDYEYVMEPAPGARLTIDAITLPGGGMIGARLEI